MRSSRNHNRGLAKCSPQRQTSKDNNKNKKSSTKNDVISNYFTRTAKTRKEDSKPIQNIDGYSPYMTALSEIKTITNDDEHDFKTPKPIKKLARIFTNPKSPKTKNARKAKAVKKSNLVLNDLKSNFKSDEFNSEHLQMAIALSKSADETTNCSEITNCRQTTNVNAAQQDEDDLIPTYASTQQVRENARLELFGFRVNSRKNLNNSPITKAHVETNKRKKKSRFQFVTPTLLLRTEEDRQEIIANKISSILNENETPDNFFSTKTFDSTPYSADLKQIYCPKSKIFHLNNLPLKELNVEHKFYVNDFKNYEQKYCCGSLLKNWADIAGRDLSPPRSNDRKRNINQKLKTIIEPQLLWEKTQMKTGNEIYNLKQNFGDGELVSEVENKKSAINNENINCGNKNFYSKVIGEDSNSTSADSNAVSAESNAIIIDLNPITADSRANSADSVSGTVDLHVITTDLNAISANYYVTAESNEVKDTSQSRANKNEEVRITSECARSFSNANLKTANLSLNFKRSKSKTYDRSVSPDLFDSDEDIFTNTNTSSRDKSDTKFQGVSRIHKTSEESRLQNTSEESRMQIIPEECKIRRTFEESKTLKEFKIMKTSGESGIQRIFDGCRNERRLEGSRTTDESRLQTLEESRMQEKPEECKSLRTLEKTSSQKMLKKSKIQRKSEESKIQRTVEGSKFEKKLEECKETGNPKTSKKSKMQKSFEESEVQEISKNERRLDESRIQRKTGEANIQRTSDEPRIQKTSEEMEEISDSSNCDFIEYDDNGICHFESFNQDDAKLSDSSLDSNEVTKDVKNVPHDETYKDNNKEFCKETKANETSDNKDSTLFLKTVGVSKTRTKLDANNLNDLTKTNENDVSLDKDVKSNSTDHKNERNQDLSLTSPIIVRSRNNFKRRRGFKRICSSNLVETQANENKTFVRSEFVNPVGNNVESNSKCAELIDNQEEGNKSCDHHNISVNDCSFNNRDNNFKHGDLSSFNLTDNGSFNHRDNISLNDRDNTSFNRRDNSTLNHRDDGSINNRDNSSFNYRDNDNFNLGDNSNFTYKDMGSYKYRDNSSIKYRDISSFRDNSNLNHRDMSSFKCRENSSFNHGDNISFNRGDNTSLINRYSSGRNSINSENSFALKENSLNATNFVNHLLNNFNETVGKSYDSLGNEGCKNDFVDLSQELDDAEIDQSNMLLNDRKIKKASEENFNLSERGNEEETEFKLIKQTVGDNQNLSATPLQVDRSENSNSIEYIRSSEVIELSDSDEENEAEKLENGEVSIKYEEDKLKNEVKNREEKMNNAKRRLKSKEEKLENKEKLRNEEGKLKNEEDNLKNTKEKLKNEEKNRNEERKLNEAMKVNEEKLRNEEEKLKLKNKNILVNKEEKLKNAKRKLKSEEEKLENEEILRHEEEKLKNEEENLKNTKEKLKNTKAKLKNEEKIRNEERKLNEAMKVNEEKLTNEERKLKNDEKWSKTNKISFKTNSFHNYDSFRDINQSIRFSDHENVEENNITSFNPSYNFETLEDSDQSIRLSDLDASNQSPYVPNAVIQLSDSESDDNKNKTQVTGRSVKKQLSSTSLDSKSHPESDLDQYIRLSDLENRLNASKKSRQQNVVIQLSDSKNEQQIDVGCTFTTQLFSTSLDYNTSQENVCKNDSDQSMRLSDFENRLNASAKQNISYYARNADVQVSDSESDDNKNEKQVIRRSFIKQLSSTSLDSSASQESICISDEEINYSSIYSTPVRAKKSKFDLSDTESESDKFGTQNSEINVSHLLKQIDNETTQSTSSQMQSKSLQMQSTSLQSLHTLSIPLHKENEEYEIVVDTNISNETNFQDLDANYEKLSATPTNPDKIYKVTRETGKILHPRVKELSTKKSLNFQNHTMFDDTFASLLQESKIINQIEHLVTEKCTPVTEKCTPDKCTPEKSYIHAPHNYSPQNSTPEGAVIIKTNNVTPMADYDAMSTPEIAKALELFGLKKLKRQRGVCLLKYLYESTHPVLESRDVIGNENIDEDNDRVVKRKKLLLDDTIIQEEIGSNSIEIATGLSESEIQEEMIFERKDSKKIHSCRLPLHIAWHNFVSCNRNIQENILLYEPLQVEVLHDMLKAQGLKYHIQDLITFLDKKCITFRMNQKHGSKSRGKNK